MLAKLLVVEDRAPLIVLVDGVIDTGDQRVIAFGYCDLVGDIIDSRGLTDVGSGIELQQSYSGWVEAVGRNLVVREGSAVVVGVKGERIVNLDTAPRNTDAAGVKAAGA